MKVKELIERLQTFPADFDVILSSDQEGNGFRSIDDCFPGSFEEISPGWFDYLSEEEDFNMVVIYPV